MKRVTETATMPARMKMYVFVGLVCIGQFFICALIGVFRGYSVQSWIPYYVMIGGVFLLLKLVSEYAWVLYLISLTMIFTSITGILQGRYEKQGDALFEQGKFSEAIVVYGKEIDTWYLRGCYNHHESTSSFRIAESYCQLEEFDKARQRYRQLAQRYKGYYKERSIGEAAQLDRELNDIADLQEQLVNEGDDDKKAKILFDIAFAYRRIECDNKARDQYELIQTLDIYQPRKEQAKKFSESI